MHVQLLEEEELPLSFWDGLAPQVERESVVGAAENTNKVVLLRLEGFFGNVAAMIIGRDQLLQHVRGCYLNFVSSKISLTRI